MSIAYGHPMHRPWCKGVSHDGECPSADSPLFRLRVDGICEICGRVDPCTRHPLISSLSPQTPPHTEGER